MKTLAKSAVRFLAFSVFLLIGAAGVDAQPQLLAYDFNLYMAPADNVEFVKSLGYQGLVTRIKNPVDLVTLEDYARYVDRIGDFKLLAYVAFDFTNLASQNVWRHALPILAKMDSPPVMRFGAATSTTWRPWSPTMPTRPPWWPSRGRTRTPMWALPTRSFSGVTSSSPSTRAATTCCPFCRRSKTRATTAL